MRVLEISAQVGPVVLSRMKDFGVFFILVFHKGVQGI